MYVVVIINCILNIFNIVNILKWFYFMYVTFLFFMVVKTLLKNSWLISYYPVNVNVSQHLMILMVGNDSSWLMLKLSKC